MNFKDMIRGGEFKLKPTQTKVKTVDGKVFIEDKEGLKQVDEQSTGFVVDLKPDLSVSEILPWLFLTSQDVPSDLELLRKHEINTILNVGSGIENKFPEHMKYHNIELLDLPEQDIKSALNESGEILLNCKKTGSKCIVHCNAGVSRSATIVIGYLMLREGSTFHQAFQLVKSRRPMINPNPGFLHQLRNLDK
eukprot:TRINITY_DN43440_c0_g1_i11.p1 TRINITY_DN43440_c0_g1~~TRINITY_DN43440_c0_g1_i11.p1  ORF type:complete len:204 (-),score=14.94 TRINITY_DN43440_c0_g1_i11:250-828(-)